MRPAVVYAYKYQSAFLGFSALTAQILFLRAFISLFSGNELVIGIVFSAWMLLTALGARLASRVKSSQVESLLYMSFGLQALLPPILLWGADYYRYRIFDLGVMADVFSITVLAAAALLPFCLLSGAAFTLLAHKGGSNDADEVLPRVYAWESLGSMTAGICFSFVFAFFLRTPEILLVSVAVNSLAACFSSRKTFGRLMVLVLPMALCALLIKYPSVELMSKQHLYPLSEIVRYEDSPYGSLCVTRRSGQLNYFSNGILLFSSDDAQSGEETVHYAMLQHEAPERVLLVAGGMASAIPEIQKYHISRLDYLELDPALIKILKQYSGKLNGTALRVIQQDARRYIMNEPNIYDVIIINLPDPSNAQLNRYYTREFFWQAKKRMAGNGIFQISLQASAEYMSPLSRRTNSILYKTLKTAFRHVLPVPGQRNYFLASDSALSLNIPALSEKRGINNVYVNRYYIDTSYLYGRSRFILRQMDAHAPVNSDHEPVAYYAQIEYWLSYFNANSSMFYAAIIILIAALFFILKPLNLAIFSGGLTAASMQVWLLFSFQLLFGYIYQMLGLLTALFMAGLFLGSNIYKLKLASSYGLIFPLLILLLAVYCFMLPLFFQIAEASAGMEILGFPALILCISILTGAQFAVASSLTAGLSGERAARLYSFDLAGSALGAFLVSVLLIPVAGYSNTGYILGLFNLAVLLRYVLTKSRN